jgi:hypothetical protein
MLTVALHRRKISSITFNEFYTTVKGWPEYEDEDYIGHVQ